MTATLTSAARHVHRARGCSDTYKSLTNISIGTFKWDGLKATDKVKEYAAETILQDRPQMVFWMETDAHQAKFFDYLVEKAAPDYASVTLLKDFLFEPAENSFIVNDEPIKTGQSLCVEASGVAEGQPSRISMGSGRCQSYEQRKNQRLYAAVLLVRNDLSASVSAGTCCEEGHGHPKGLMVARVHVGECPITFVGYQFSPKLKSQEGMFKAFDQFLENNRLQKEPTLAVGDVNLRLVVPKGAVDGHLEEEQHPEKGDPDKKVLVRKLANKMMTDLTAKTMDPKFLRWDHSEMEGKDAIDGRSVRLTDYQRRFLKQWYSSHEWLITQGKNGIPPPYPTYQRTPWWQTNCFKGKGKVDSVPPEKVVRTVSELAEENWDAECLKDPRSMFFTMKSKIPKTTTRADDASAYLNLDAEGRSILMSYGWLDRVFCRPPVSSFCTYRSFEVLEEVKGFDHAMVLAKVGSAAPQRVQTTTT